MSHKPKRCINCKGMMDRVTDTYHPMFPQLTQNQNICSYHCFDELRNKDKSLNRYFLDSDELFESGSTLRCHDCFSREFGNRYVRVFNVQHETRYIGQCAYLVCDDCTDLSAD